MHFELKFHNLFYYNEEIFSNFQEVDYNFQGRELLIRRNKCNLFSNVKIQNI